MRRLVVAGLAGLALAMPAPAVARTTVRLPHGARLVVPTGSLTRGARIVVRHGRGHRVGLKVAGGRVVGPLRLSFPFHRRVRTRGMPLDLSVQVRFRNPATRQWAAVPTHVDRRHHRVIATISPTDWRRASLTLGGVGGSSAGGSTWWNPFTWDWGNIALRLDQRVGELRGGRTGPAQCTAGVPVPSWAVVTVNNGADLPLRTCAEGQGDKVVVQIVNNRPYGVILTYGTGVSWGWHQPTGDAAGDVGLAFADTLVSPRELYIAPLKAASVGVAPGPFGFALFQASITKKSLAADLLRLALDGVDARVVRPQVLGSLAASCSWLLEPRLDGLPTIEPGDALSNVREVAGCLADAAPSLAAHGLLDAVKVDTIQHSLTLLRRVGLAAEAAKVAGALADLYVGSHGGIQGLATFGITSHVTPAVAPAPSPAPTATAQPGSGPTPPQQTWAETTGGAANTWTNYANAGGSQGPTIPAYTTVQIACRLSGFRVADGDTWWYRVASGPWSNQFYVSADAFYNNGQTSGSLHGTPFVDPAVAGC